MRQRALYNIGSLVFMFCSLNTSAFAEEGVGQARFLHAEGKVEVKFPNETIWKLPKAGAWIPKDSEIKTGPASNCEIGLGQGRGNVLKMKQNSHTVLDTLNADHIRVNLEAGSIFALVRTLKRDSKFEVKTPTAIASARGTGWEQDMDSVEVFEHAVEVEGSGGEMLTVEEGNGIDIEADGNLDEVHELSADAKEEWAEFETQAEEHVKEEAALPQDAGYEEPSGSGQDSSATQPGEAGGSDEGGKEADESGFESFDNDFGADAQEGEADSEALSEAHDDQRDDEGSQDESDDDDDQHCVSQTVC